MQVRSSMIRKKGTRFSERSCSIKELERDGCSIDEHQPPKQRARQWPPCARSTTIFVSSFSTPDTSSSSCWTCSRCASKWRELSLLPARTGRAPSRADHRRIRGKLQRLATVALHPHPCAAGTDRCGMPSRASPSLMSQEIRRDMHQGARANAPPELLSGIAFVIATSASTRRMPFASG
jgi:hypothetical protein